MKPETDNAVAKRSSIINTAAELYDRKGYHDTSMDDLAAEVGLAKPSLYHYVRGKAEILSEIHEEFIELLIRRQEARAKEQLAPAVQLLGVMSDIIELMETHRGHVRVFFEHHRDLPKETREAVHRRRDVYQRSVIELIEAGIRDGSFRPVDSRLAALSLFGMCNWSYQWYRSEGSLTTAEIAQFMWDVLMRGLQSDPKVGTSPTFG